MQANSIQQNARNLDMENMDKTGIEKQTNKQTNSSYFIGGKIKSELHIRWYN